MGKGIRALLPEEESTTPKSREIELSKIKVKEGQPREKFDEEKLEELAQSIEKHGLIQPVVVRKIEGKEEYELIAGERRLRAYLKLQKEKIPAIVAEIDNEAAAAEIALIENIQREDLTPLEEAKAYQTLLNDFGLTQEELAKRLSKNRASIANTIRLLNLPAAVQKLVEEGLITAGHARALLGLPEEEMLKIAQRIVKEGLNVRQTEKIVQQRERTGKKEKENPPLFYREIEEKLGAKLGSKVKVKKAKKGGTLEIKFKNEEELKRLLALFWQEA